jgi:predicted nucleotidyltransferase
MRLTAEERDLLKRTLHTLDPEAEILLFGSRTDDRKRGGDIDLLIRSRSIDRRAVRKLRVAFYEKFGEQKIDIVVDDGTPSPFIDLIANEALPL